MRYILPFILSQLFITSFIIIYYVKAYRNSENAKRKRREKTLLEFYNKTATATWEAEKEPFITYKTTKN